MRWFLIPLGKTAGEFVREYGNPVDAPAAVEVLVEVLGHRAEVHVADEDGPAGSKLFNPTAFG